METKNYVSPVDNTEKFEKVSERYSLINTRRLVNIAENQGFTVASIQYPKGKNGQYGQHVVKLDLPGYDAKQIGEYRPQIVIKNSHDGNSRLCIMGGVFRLICSNGLIAGNAFLNIRMRHVGLKQETIEEQLQVAAQQVCRLVEHVERFKSVQLSPEQVRFFAEEALKARAAIGGLSSNETADLVHHQLFAVLNTRRPEDNGNGLWEVLNRVQENTTQNSGLLYKGDDTKTHRLYAVRAIRQNINLNQTLWEIAEKFAA